MTKNLKLSFVLYMVFYSVIIAWATLFNFFHGVGVNFVALIITLGVILSIKLTDEHTSNRTKEMFWASVAFAGLEFLLYFFIEFGIARGRFFLVLDVFQHIFTSFALLVLAYIIFRYITEIKNVKIGFVEIILGNEKPIKKVKTNKELSNGSLEDKPNKPIENNVEEMQNTNFANTQTSEPTQANVQQEANDEL